MTTINANTFEGPNQGLTGGYVPHTDILSDSIDADFNQILADLDYHLLLLQTAFTKLDQIDLESLGSMTAAEIIAALTGTTEKIAAANLDDLVITVSKLNDAITAHLSSTNANEMHSETSVKSTGLAYGANPAGIITSCNNLYDELMNIRYQLNKIVGKTSWIENPDSSIAALKAALDTLNANYTAHSSNTAVHLTAEQNAALDASHSPSGSNPYATINDIADKGAGDMLRSVYDSTSNGIVDKAEGLAYGASVITYPNIISFIDGRIATHLATVSHTAYTNDMARGAINSDSDHSSTACHYYNDLIGKPAAIAAASFTSNEVTNLRASKLANGTSPWDSKASLVNGVLPAYLAQNVLNISNLGGYWNENSSFLRTASGSYFSSGGGGNAWTNINGPAIVYGGTGYRTQDWASLTISINNGGAAEVSMSPPIVGAWYGSTRAIMVWTCPAIFIPSGYSWKIVATNTRPYNSSGNDVFGAGYHIAYRLL